MPTYIDYYFTPISPWAFLGSERFHAIAAKAGAEIAYRPVDYGKIFPVSGGLPLSKRAPQRQAYRLVELRRWADHLGIPFYVFEAVDLFRENVIDPFVGSYLDGETPITS